MKKLLLSVILSSIVLTGCDVNDADVVSQNLSKDSDNFKVTFKPSVIVPDVEMR